MITTFKQTHMWGLLLLLSIQKRVGRGMSHSEKEKRKRKEEDVETIILLHNSMVT